MTNQEPETESVSAQLPPLLSGEVAPAAEAAPPTGPPSPADGDDSSAAAPTQAETGEVETAAAPDFAGDPTPPDVPPTELPATDGAPPPVSPAAEDRATQPPSDAEVPTPADVAADRATQPPSDAEVPTPADVAADRATQPPGDAEVPTPADVAEDRATQPPGDAEVPTPADAAESLRARFDAAAGELGTLAGRIQADELPPKAANAELERIRAAAATGGPLPDALAPHLEVVERLLAEKAAAARAARAEATAAAREIKDRIIAEAEELATGDQWRGGGQRLAELLEEWKVCARLDRKSDDAMWKRFSSARSAFTKRRKAHYATLSADRDTVKSAKVALVEQAEALASSTDWAATATRFRELMQEWKGVGRAGKDIDDELWERFRAAQDTFFAARKDAAPAAPQRETAPRRESAPRGPRPERRPAAAAMSAPERPRTNPAAVARAQETVETLRGLIESFEAKAAKANAAGDTKAANNAKEAAEARREWLAEAEKTLAELS